MYAVAARLDPDTYLALARATFREMVAAGITCVGEFHYLHRRPTARPTPIPTRWGWSWSQAARQAGIRITLLDTLYLSSGFGAAPEGAQVRYVDGSVEAWAERVDGLDRRRRTPVTGAAVHSVRAVPASELRRGRGVGRRPPASRPPLRAGRRERGLPRGVRRHAHPAARRPRPASRPTTSPGPRHPPHRRRHRPHRRRGCLRRPSARRPSATSATASVRRDGSTTPVPG